MYVLQVKQSLQEIYEHWIKKGNKGCYRMRNFVLHTDSHFSCIVQLRGYSRQGNGLDGED